MGFFVHRSDGVVIINDEIFDIILFQKMFPEYTLPQGMEQRKYVQEKHHYISDGSAVYHQEMPWHLGDIIISRLNDIISVRSLWDEQKKQEEEELKQVEFDNKPYKEKRKAEYPPIDDLIVALWEHIVEERPPVKMKEIQELRKSIKRKYPKKEA